MVDILWDNDFETHNLILFERPSGIKYRGGNISVSKPRR